MPNPINSQQPLNNKIDSSLPKREEVYYGSRTIKSLTNVKPIMDQQEVNIQDNALHGRMTLAKKENIDIVDHPVVHFESKKKTETNLSKAYSLLGSIPHRKKHLITGAGVSLMIAGLATVPAGIALVMFGLSIFLSGVGIQSGNKDNTQDMPPINNDTHDDEKKKQTTDTVESINDSRLSENDYYETVELPDESENDVTGNIPENSEQIIEDLVDQTISNPEESFDEKDEDDQLYTKQDFIKKDSVNCSSVLIKGELNSGVVDEIETPESGMMNEYTETVQKVQKNVINKIAISKIVNPELIQDLSVQHLKIIEEVVESIKEEKPIGFFSHLPILLAPLLNKVSSTKVQKIIQSIDLLKKEEDYSNLQLACNKVIQSLGELIDVAEINNKNIIELVDDLKGLNQAEISVDESQFVDVLISFLEKKQFILQVDDFLKNEQEKIDSLSLAAKNWVIKCFIELAELDQVDENAVLQVKYFVLKEIEHDIKQENDLFSRIKNKYQLSEEVQQTILLLGMKKSLK